MAGNKFPGTFTPALSQELISPELNSGIIIPSYQREYECWLEIIFLNKFGKFFPEKNSPGISSAKQNYCGRLFRE